MHISLDSKYNHTITIGSREQERKNRGREKLQINIKPQTYPANVRLIWQSEFWNFLSESLVAAQNHAVTVGSREESQDKWKEDFVQEYDKHLWIQSILTSPNLSTHMKAYSAVANIQSGSAEENKKRTRREKEKKLHILKKSVNAHSPRQTYNLI